MAKLLDATALVAFLRREAGFEAVAACLVSGARACTVNLSEVVAVLVRRGMNGADASALVSDLPVEAVDFDKQLAMKAGELIALTRQLGLSFGDRACLALGMRDGDTIVTADHDWAKLPLDISNRLEFFRLPSRTTNQ